MLGAAKTALIAAQEPPAIPSFQRGGIATAGTTALVGEEGPELVQFSRSARVIPSRETNQMTGRPIKIINNFTGPINSELDLQKAGNIFGEQLRRKLRGAS